MEWEDFTYNRRTDSLYFGALASKLVYPSTVSVINALLEVIRREKWRMYAHIFPLWMDLPPGFHLLQTERGNRMRTEPNLMDYEWYSHCVIDCGEHLVITESLGWLWKQSLVPIAIVRAPEIPFAFGIRLDRHASLPFFDWIDVANQHVITDYVTDTIGWHIGHRIGSLAKYALNHSVWTQRMNNEPEETEPEATLWFDSGLTDQGRSTGTIQLSYLA